MWLVKVAYDGTKFFGSQIQPKIPTVDGEISRVLKEGKFGGVPKFASRTDKGVSARCNVFCYKGEPPRLGQLNNMIEDIWCWAYTEVEEGFNVRHVKKKEYRYMLVEDYDMQAMKEAAKYFEGEHDFINFSKRKTDTIRTIQKIKVTKKYVSFIAQGFLWEQIRRIMTTLIDVGEGKIKPAAVKKLFSARDGVRPAPPEGLILWDIDYGISFKESKARVAWQQKALHAAAIEQVSKSLTRSQARK